MTTHPQPILAYRAGEAERSWLLASLLWGVANGSRAEVALPGSSRKVNRYPGDRWLERTG